MDVQEIFDQFTNKRILVIGDVMIDSYIHGHVSRISPEAPVPVVNYHKTENRLGGAANVALNLRSLGAQALVASIVGDDQNGVLIMNLFGQNEIDCSALVMSSQRRTTVKTRVLAGFQQLLRIDDEHSEEISVSEENQLIEKIKLLHAEKALDAIIFEDYNKGVLTPGLISQLIAFSKKENILTAVDPKKDHFFAYQGVDLFKPNLKELREGLNLPINKNILSELVNAVKSLKQKLDHHFTLVTLSENGVAICSKDDFTHIKAHIRNISDVSGAGDTVIAVATLCLAAGLEPRQIAEISNLAGGLVCEKSGVVSIDKTELYNEVKKVLIS